MNRNVVFVLNKCMLEENVKHCCLSGSLPLPVTDLAVKEMATCGSSLFDVHDHFIFDTLPCHV